MGRRKKMPKDVNRLKVRRADVSLLVVKPTKETRKIAIERVLAGESPNRVASETGVSRGYLITHTKGTKQEDGTYRVLDFDAHQGKTSLPPHLEMELVEIVRRCEDSKQPLLRSEVMKRAAELDREYAARNKRARCFGPDGPSNTWYDQGFKPRVERLGYKISTRLPQHLDSERLNHLTPEIATQTIEEWEKVLKSNKYPRSNIWIMDEVGIGGKQRTRRVVTMTGAKKVQSVGFCRTDEFTLIPMFNCEGKSTLCGVIMSGNISAREMKAMEGWGYAYPKGPKGGHMQDTASMHEFIKFMAKHLGATPTNRHLIKLDGHKSRNSNEGVESVIQYAYDLGIDLFQLASHTTSEMCEIDTHLNKPLKQAYGKLYRDLANHHPRQKTLPRVKVIELIREAHEMVASVHLLKKSWGDTGFMPINKEKLLARLPKVNICSAVETQVVDYEIIDDDELDTLGRDARAIPSERTEAFGKMELPSIDDKFDPCPSKGYKAHSKALFLSAIEYRDERRRALEKIYDDDIEKVRAQCERARNAVLRQSLDWHRKNARENARKNKVAIEAAFKKNKDQQNDAVLEMRKDLAGRAGLSPSATKKYMSNKCTGIVVSSPVIVTMEQGRGRRYRRATAKFAEYSSSPSRGSPRKISGSPRGTWSPIAKEATRTAKKACTRA